mmetsp:Transcript_49635/g.105490  ORF Transcript_49635/g.105490 Transcript_49635/m.105490 type:complete len:219 (-) Transcript_49635:81-737(-)
MKSSRRFDGSSSRSAFESVRSRLCVLTTLPMTLMASKKRRLNDPESDVSAMPVSWRSTRMSGATISPDLDTPSSSAPSRSNASPAASSAASISQYTAALACPARIRQTTFPVSDGALTDETGSARPSSLRVPTSSDMASATSGGGGTSSHLRRNRRDADGAESGRRWDTRGGMAGSERRPNCVAVSRWSGRVIVVSLPSERDPDGDGDDDDDATTTKS